MEFVSRVKEKRVLDIREVLEGEYESKEIWMNGTVHTVRRMGEVAFVIPCKSRGLVQCVYETGITDFDIRELKEESAVKIISTVKAKERTPQSFEIRLEEIRVPSRPAEPLPLATSKWKLSTSLETGLSLYPISLRNAREQAKFRIQEDIVRGFGDYLLGGDFTEIRTPKIVARGVEDGSNVFKLGYFNKKIGLRQSPQSYKQAMMDVCDRAFEAAPVFRTEKHNTTRRLNGYTSLGFEMGYIDSFRDVVGMETRMLQCIIKLLGQNYKKGLDMLGMTLSEIGRIPAARFDQAKELVSRKYDRKIRNPYDLEPEEKLLIGRYFQEEYGSDFVFVTHYLSGERPFYAMDDPTDPRFTLGFDPLSRGLEVTTGEQRIHNYKEITAKMERRGMDPEDITSCLMIFKYDIPPHDGLGIGLKRLTMRLLDEQSARGASLFPRDVTRLEP